MADLICRKVATTPCPVMGGAESLTITMSVCIAATTGVDDPSNALMKRAGQVVYEAKNRGRNQVIARAA